MAKLLCDLKLFWSQGYFLHGYMFLSTCIHANHACTERLKLSEFKICVYEIASKPV